MIGKKIYNLEFHIRFNKPVAVNFRQSVIFRNFKVQRCYKKCLINFRSCLFPCISSFSILKNSVQSKVYSRLNKPVAMDYMLGVIVPNLITWDCPRIFLDNF